MDIEGIRFRRKVFYWVWGISLAIGAFLVRGMNEEWLNPDLDVGQMTANIRVMLILINLILVFWFARYLQIHWGLGLLYVACTILYTFVWWVPIVMLGVHARMAIKTLQLNTSVEEPPKEKHVNSL